MFRDTIIDAGKHLELLSTEESSSNDDIEQQHSQTQEISSTFDSHINQAIRIGCDEIDYILNEGIYQSPSPIVIATLTVTDELLSDEHDHDLATSTPYTLPDAHQRRRDDIMGILGPRPQVLQQHNAVSQSQSGHPWVPPSTIRLARPERSIIRTNP